MCAGWTGNIIPHTNANHMENDVVGCNIYIYMCSAPAYIDTNMDLDSMVL